MALGLAGARTAAAADRYRDRSAVWIEPPERERVDQVEDAEAQSLQHAAMREQLRCQRPEGRK
jgi:hypothetical protein